MTALWLFGIGRMKTAVPNQITGPNAGGRAASVVSWGGVGRPRRQVLALVTVAHRKSYYRDETPIGRLLGIVYDHVRWWVHGAQPDQVRACYCVSTHVCWGTCEIDYPVPLGSALPRDGTSRFSSWPLRTCVFAQADKIGQKNRRPPRSACWQMTDCRWQIVLAADPAGAGPLWGSFETR